MVANTAMLAGRPHGSNACAAVGHAVALLVPPAKLPQSRPRAKLGGKLGLTRKARQDFLDGLARTGDPAGVAKDMKLSLVGLFQLRARDADFAAGWQAAIDFAWEQVELRVLAQLLDKANDALDSKLALAIIARREQGQARVQGRRVDSAAVARLRAELRALTGPDAGKS